MMRISHFVRRLARTERGVTILEFAFVGPSLILFLLASLDIGYRIYAESVVSGTLEQAARLATIGDKTSGQIDTFINNKIMKFPNAGSVTINKSNYYQFSNIQKAEKLTSDSAPLGVWNTGDCYEDLNGNGKWDATGGRTGLGGSDDIVFYQVTMQFQHLVPLMGLLGWSDTETVSANTVMRNQPYASQIVPTIKCTST